MKRMMKSSEDTVRVKEEPNDTLTNAVHNQSKPFECEICHKSFGQKGYLNKHIKMVHDSRKPFECEICSKSFGRKHYLEYHIDTVHNQVECKKRDIYWDAIEMDGKDEFEKARPEI
uniref:C2H2-type domain-containing protein n=1 Tax=Trichogramma kaykai TaxID=54128 RepID=A0ABD2WUY8_9HYME